MYIDIVPGTVYCVGILWFVMSKLNIGLYDIFEFIENNHLYSGNVMLLVAIVMLLSAGIFIVSVLKFCAYPNIFDIVPVIEIF